MAPKKGYKKRAPRRKARTVSTAVKKYVKSAITTRGNRKIWVSQALNTNILTVATQTPTSLYLLPTPSNGSGDSDKIGNKITVLKASVRGFVNLSPYDATTNPNAFSPCWVKMWVVSSKQENTNVFSNTPASTEFFRSNNGSIGFQATMRDQLYPVNTELFTVHKVKTFKLGLGSTSSVANPASYFDNSPMSHPFSFNLTKYIKGTVLYDESNTWATNKNLFLVFTVTRCDGGTSSATNPLAEYFSMIEYQYLSY